MGKDFDEIYRLYADGVYRYILSLCRDETLAEDILQNTMLKAFTKADSFAGASSVKTWLCSIARNEYFSHLKKSDNKNVPLDENADYKGEDPEEKAISDLSAVEILKLVHVLDEPFREVFMLRFYGSLQFSEIGEVFGKSGNWARVTFFRAREKLAQSLEKEDLV